MKLAGLTYLLLLGMIMTASINAQESPAYEVTQLNDHIYELTIDGGGYTVKVIASVGRDGILLVDAGKEEHAEALKTALARFGGEAPKIIINTHAHVEHIGGNAVFGGKPIIIGHEKVRTRMTSGSLLFDEFPDEALPDITFSDSMSLFFNGEEIKLKAFPGAHDNCDIIAWFTASKLVCVAALSNGSHFPSVDEASGDVYKYPEVVGRVIAILPEDVRIIPGHGADGTMDDYRKFHDMLVKTTAIVRAEATGGKDAATLKKEDVLKDWTSFEGSYVDKATWIDYLVTGLQPPNPLLPIYDPMYYALKEKGVDGAIETYLDLKKNHADKYRFIEIELLIIPYKLFGDERYADAVKLSELWLKEYPNGEYAWLMHHNMGRSYMMLGDKERARQHLKKSLELNPDNPRAKEFLEELDKG